MHIINAMFSKGLGGIEQSLVDYCEALKMQGHKVTALIYPRAKIKAALLPLGVNIIEVKNFAGWDFLARAYIKKIFKQLAPDAVITHGNRAVSLINNLDSSIPTIGVTHNYSIKHLIGLNAIFATTEDLKNKVIEAGQPEDKVFKLPNMVRIRCQISGARYQEKDYLIPDTCNLKPVVIGTMGRFVKKKGFDVYIQAIADLKKQGVNFQAVVGGGGEEEENLKELAKGMGLTKDLTFIGWISNKNQFFENIDIFVLPSIHEPFGIILLEAFAYGKPVVVADSEGPSEIAENNVDAVVVKKGDSKAISDGIIKLINDPVLASVLAKNAYMKAGRYDIQHFAAALGDAVEKVVNK